MPRRLWLPIISLASLLVFGAAWVTPEAALAGATGCEEGFKLKNGKCKPVKKAKGCPAGTVPVPETDNCVPKGILRRRVREGALEEAWLREMAEAMRSRQRPCLRQIRVHLPGELTGPIVAPISRSGTCLLLLGSPNFRARVAVCEALRRG